MATLAQLEEKKRELEERLFAGDLSAEALLAQVDRAIEARTKKIQHSRKRIAAAKEAVAAGLPREQVRKDHSDNGKPRKPPPKRGVNRFE